MSLGKPFPPERMLPQEESRDEHVPLRERSSALCQLSLGSHCLGPLQLPGPKIIWEALIREAEGWSWGGWGDLGSCNEDGAGWKVEGAVVTPGPARKEEAGG